MKRSWRIYLCGFATTILAIQFSYPILGQTTLLEGSAQKSTHTKQETAQTINVTKPKTVVVTKYQEHPSYWKRHPKIKSATIGAGVGAGVGAVTGLVSGKGVVRGAAIGAGTGAGVGLIHSSATMKRHPILKTTTEGATVGLGLGLAATKGHGSGKKVGAATAIGAAVGLGAGLLNKLK